MATIPPPTTPKVTGIITTPEGGGHVVTCECRWLRFYESEKDAAEGRTAHIKKCKAHKVVTE